MKFYVGNYEFGTVPVADTDPATALPDTAVFSPGTYQLLAAGKGLGHKRFTFVVRPGGSTVAGVVLTANLASAASGATVSGDGANMGALIDEVENTSNWDTVNGVAGKQATVDLAGEGAKLVSRVQVSASGGRSPRSARSRCSPVTPPAATTAPTRRTTG